MSATPDDVVVLDDTDPRGADVALLRDALGTTPPEDDDIAGHLDWARTWGPRLPLPGEGRTLLLWGLLASLGARGLQLARTVEPHLDALAILHQAGVSTPAGRTWGVYAAEGPAAGLTARPAPADPDAPWRLDGFKPWCSLAGQVSHALVTAWVEESSRGLFAVDLADPGVTLSDEPWVSHGLPDVRSTGVSLETVGAVPVGGPGWYLARDGFAWGGIGVAAIWYGASVALWRRLARPGARQPDQVALMHIGAADASLSAARALLVHAAGEVDAGRAAGRDGAVLAARVRSVVATASAEVLGRVERALGPKPLVAEADHAARVSDLRVYLRQHHDERDDAALGRLLTEGR